MKTLKQEYKIKSSKSKVWDAITNQRTINKWGAGPSRMKPVTGFKFSLWGGDIHGINTKVIEAKELNQDWMAGKWEEYSKVVIKLSEKSGVTKAVLIHSNIPRVEFKDIEDGWKTSYFGEIKKFLEGET